MKGRAVPMRAQQRDQGGAQNIIEVHDLTVRFDIKGGLLQRAVRRVTPSKA